VYAEQGPTPTEWRSLPFWYALEIANTDLDWKQLEVRFGAPRGMTPQEWVGLHFLYKQDPVRWFEALGLEGSCFVPFGEWVAA
ncbi:unnamed protein product, partial [Polarella glacialis]